jgi:DNA-directed RNA polymerase subunit D
MTDAGKRAASVGGASKMEVVMLEKSENKISFLLKNATPALANMLRIYAMEEVPVMAIEDVEIRKNNSILYDEIIGHRLGLIPLETDLKSYNLPEKCKCGGKGCARCTLKLTLDTKGPANVYASDLKSADPKVKPVFPKMLITKLYKGQDLEFEATAVLGKGKEHIKWSAGHVWYSFKAKITVNNDHPDFEKFKNLYPSQVFKNNKIDKALIEELNLVDACDSVNKEIVNIEYDPTSFVFHVESWGQLETKEMVLQALDIFDEDLDEFASKLKDTMH